MRIPITVSVFSVILTICLALSITIVSFTYLRQKEAALVSTGEVMERSAEILRLRTAGLIYPINQVSRFSVSWPGIEKEPDYSGHPSFERLLGLVRSFPQLAAINLGYASGSYYMVASARTRAREEMQEMEAPSGTEFIERIILRGNGRDGRPLTRFIGADGSVLGSTWIGPVGYDPRNRPWFRSVWHGASEGISQVYLFHGSQKPGLTISRRHAAGVVGADITLRQLEHFLESDRFSYSGVLGVLGVDGEILAEAGQSGNTHAVLKAVKDILHSDPDFRQGVLLVEGIEWIAHVDPAPFGPGSKEHLALALPVSALAAPVIRVSQSALIISVLITVASIPLIWLVSRSFSRPLVVLANEAERIRQFDLERRDYHPSRINEIYQLQTALSRMNASLGIFGSYVPKALVRTFLERDVVPELGGEERYVTALFMDLENFTAMSAELEPAETMRRMSDLFEVVTQVLLAHGATIDKYIGDAVMAFWNAPDAVEDHEKLACQAAIEMRDAANKEIAKWQLGDQIPMRPRIGLHCGPAIVGNVGSSDRMNFTALGATVNLAARLEAENKGQGTSILVSDDMARIAGPGFHFNRVGEVTLKGFPKPVAAWELIDEKAA